MVGNYHSHSHALRLDGMEIEESILDIIITFHKRTGYDGLNNYCHSYCKLELITLNSIDHVHGGNTGWHILFPALRRSTRVQSLSWLSPKTILRPQSLPICIYLNSIIFRFYYQPRGARRLPWPPPCTTNSSYQPRGARRPPWPPPLNL